MPADVDRYFDVLAEAKTYADECAKRDGTAWNVCTSDYTFGKYAAGDANLIKKYDKEKWVYRADPNLFTLTLTKAEKKEWLEYLETVRPAGRYIEGFKGGMFANEAEKSLIDKLKGLLGV